MHERVKTAGTVALEHGSRRFDGKTRYEPRMTGHAPAVLTGLVGTAHDEIFDLLGLECRFSHQLLQDLGQQIVGAHFCERSRMAAERRTQSFVNIGIEHGGILGQYSTWAKGSGFGSR